MKSTCVFWRCLTAKLRESCRFDLSQRDYWLDSKLDGASKIMMEGCKIYFARGTRHSMDYIDQNYCSHALSSSLNPLTILLCGELYIYLWIYSFHGLYSYLESLPESLLKKPQDTEIHTVRRLTNCASFFIKQECFVNLSCVNRQEAACVQVVV